MIYAIILVSLLTVVFLALRKEFTYWRRQGIKSEGFFTFNGYLDEMHLYTLKMSKKLGRVYGGYMLANKYLVINDPDIIREMFVRYFHVFPDHSHFNLGPSHAVNKMLFFMPGDEDWKRVRSIITPTFTSGKLKAMMSHISDISDSFVANLQDFEKKGQVVDMCQYFGAFAMDSITVSTFGIKIDSINNPEHPVVVNAKSILSIDFNINMITSILFPKLASLLKLHFFNIDAINFIVKMSNEIIEKRRQINHKLELQSAKKSTDFIQLMLDSAQNDQEHSDIASNKTTEILSTDEMIGQCLIFFIAGYDTTTIALSHVVYHLAENKDCQQRLYEELKDVKEFSYENITRLKYLNAVIDEALRLSPPVLRIQRQSVQDIEINGIKIPAGSNVEVCPYALHRDPELWSDPLQFKPDRFFEPTHHPYAYLPFGGGPRVCVGQRFALNEMRMCCAKLFYRFEFSLAPGFKPQYFKGNILLSVKQMLVTLKVRQQLN